MWLFSISNVYTNVVYEFLLGKYNSSVSFWQISSNACVFVYVPGRYVLHTFVTYGDKYEEWNDCTFDVNVYGCVAGSLYRRYQYSLLIYVYILFRRLRNFCICICVALFFHRLFLCMPCSCIHTLCTQLAKRWFCFSLSTYIKMLKIFVVYIIAQNKSDEKREKKKLKKYIK